MADITVKILIIDKNKEITATIDDSYTANEILAELYKENLIEPSGKQYDIKSSWGKIISDNESLKDVNIGNNDSIIVSAQKANEENMKDINKLFIDKRLDKNPLIFISHDSRDSKLANLFGYLLKSVSHNKLIPFSSSAYGIEFGAKWYPEILKVIDKASDVVCILTKNSLNKPWILYEAGLAEAKISGKVFGIAFGVTLKKVNSSGPFFMFQNCKGTEKDLCELTKQLLKRIPDLENPDESMIKHAVEYFFKTAKPFIKNDNEDEFSFDKLYKEIKNISFNTQDICSISLDKLNHFTDYTLKLNSEWGFIFLLNLLKIDYPWLYDIGFEIIRKRSELKADELTNLISDFKKIVNFSFDKNIYETASSNRKEYISMLKQTINRIDLNKNKMIYLL